MDDRYDLYCAVDRYFYDTLSKDRRPDREFPAALRPLPPGWQRQELGEWLAFNPSRAGLPAQGWKIHISAGLDNAARVLDLVWDYCVPRDVSFKYLRGPDVLLLHNAKYAPRGASGKFITIYPRDDVELAGICQDLAEQLRGEPGPYILSDLRIGDGPVYVRYGGFASRFCVDDGEVVPAIAAADGTLVPDRRGPVFTVPEWVTPPAFLAPHLAARNAATTTDLPYRIARVMHFSNGGGLYAATDTRTGDPRVLKEARPYAGLDADGVDAVTRLRREYETLVRLADVPQVVHAYEHFEFGEHHFLTMEHVEGRSLNKLLVERYPLIDPDAGPTDRAGYTTWALHVYQQVADAVAAIHERGIVYGDLHLFNIMVRPDDSVTLLDFEVAVPADHPRRPALRNQGFAAPSDRTGPDVDRYALACLGLALFLPLTQLVRLAPASASHLAEVIAEHFPVPRPFLTEAVAVITGDQPRTVPPSPRRGGTEQPAAATPRPRLEPTPDGWRTARDLVRGAILSSATPGRDDRLFPGDIEQFRSGGLSMAYGAAGVLYTLAVTGAGRYPEHEQWLVDRALQPTAGTRCGFYDGLHGVAYALAALDRPAEALDVVELCLRQPWTDLHLDLMGGLAGIGLNLTHLAELTGEPHLRDEAVRATTLVAERVGTLAAHPPRYVGLTHGGTGPALLLLRQYERTGEPWLLDRAAVALRQDLTRCVVRDDGAMEVDEGWRTMPYLGRGSVGIGLVLDQYLAHRPDEQFAEASAAIRRAARSPFYVQSGLFAGRAGIILYLAHRLRAAAAEPASHAAERSELERQVRTLAWHALPYQGFLAFPGEQLLRLSMDLATGAAGVLLALGAALHDQPVNLPFLTPPTPPHQTSPSRAAAQVATSPSSGGECIPLVTSEGGV